MKPTLFILAAGMGSRYGGLKQLDGVGPNGETIMDYSVYDAMNAGFCKVVFVIREHFAKDFEEKIIAKYKHLIQTETVFQELDKIPEGFTLHPGREKPWGTNHAVLMGKDVIDEPFAVINADDFYGRESFIVLADFLQSTAGKKNQYCMVGYRLGNTLSENGSVSRGVCVVDERGFLQNVIERTHIEKRKDEIIYLNERNEETMLSPNTPVSMNMWGFTPDYFEHSLEYFKLFLTENGDKLKSEYFIPSVVNNLIVEDKVTCRVLDTPGKWFGVTYIDDRLQTILKIKGLIQQGVYPEKLF